MDDELKSTIQSDIDNFFKSEKVFKDLSIPWKRGECMQRGNVILLTTLCRRNFLWTAVSDALYMPDALSHISEEMVRPYLRRPS